MKSFILALLCVIPTASYGEVTNHSEQSFELSTSVIVNQPVAEVFNTFSDISQWWHPDHTFSGNAANLMLDRKSACFCERWNNNVVRHMEIVAVEENKRHVWRGGLGPLQTFAVSGALTWAFKSIDKNKTSVTYTYRVYGEIPDVKTWSKAVDGVLTQQLHRLKKAVN